MQILAVDDSAIMRDLLYSTLQAAGYEVILARDGAEALEHAQHSGTDLVITDLHMPKLDGIALIRELRRLERYRFVPMLMLTTESQPTIKQQAKAAGATGWIVKPFDPERLVSCIQRVLA